MFLEGEGHSLRGTFLIDPKGVLQSSLINNLDVGRSVDELLRTSRGGSRLVMSEGGAMGSGQGEIPAPRYSAENLPLSIAGR